MREGERERTIAATKMNENSRFVCLHIPYAGKVFIVLYLSISIALLTA